MAASSSSELPKTTFHALVIGCANYQAPFEELKFAKMDANRLGSLLKLGGYNSVQILRGTVTKIEVQAALDHLSRVQAGEEQANSSDGLALIYFAGHAKSETTDTRLYLSESSFLVSEIVDIMIGSSFQKTVVILDACQSEYIPTDAQHNRLTSLDKGLAIWSSARSDQDALEHEDLGHGLFTHCFCEGLLASITGITSLSVFVENELSALRTRMNPDADARLEAQRPSLYKCIKQQQDVVVLPNPGLARIVPQLPPYYVKNECAIAELEALLNDHSLIVISGVSGLGKTECANNLALIQARQGHHVFWVNRTSRRQKESNDVAAHLRVIGVGVGLDDDSFELLDEEAALHKFVNHMSRHPLYLTSTPCIVFIDDPQSQKLAVELSAVFQQLNFKVVITCNKRSLAPKDAFEYPMVPLSKELGVRLLRKTSRDMSDSSQLQLERIHERLGGLPIALKLLGLLVHDRHQQVQSDTWNVYREMLEQNHLDELDDSAAGISTRIAAIVEKSISRLSKKDSDFVPCFNLLAAFREGSFIAAGTIEPLWLKLLNNSRRRLARLRVALARLGLMNPQGSYNEFTLHTTISSFLRKEPEALAWAYDVRARQESVIQNRKLRSTPLIEAVVEGDDYACRQLLALRPESLGETEYLDEVYGANPLHMAAFHGNLPLCQLFLDTNTVSVNSIAKFRYARTPLLMAIIQGHASCIRLLLDYGASLDLPDTKGDLPLHEAAFVNSPQILEMILQAYPSAEARSAALRQQDVLHRTPLSSALGQEGLDLMLQYGADPDEYESLKGTAFHVAARKGSLEMLASIPESEWHLISERAPNGQTPLHIACDLNRLDFVRALLRMGADINATNKMGGVALGNASMRGYYDLVDLLLNEGANPNVTDENGNNALSTAAWRGRERIVERLLQYPAFILEKTQATDIAERSGHRRIAALLKAELVRRAQ